MNNWKDYIDTKFSPAKDFEFRAETGAPTLHIKHLGTGSIVTFYWPSDDWMEVGDVQFYHEKAQCGSPEFGNGTFTEAAVKELDNFLKPVFYTGWSCRSFGKGWGSVTYGDISHSKVLLGSGCLSLFLSPILPLLNKLFPKRIFIIPPIHTTNHLNQKP